MDLAEYFSNVYFVLFDSFASGKYFLIKVLSRGWMLMEWLFMKIFPFQAHEERAYIIWIFLVIVIFLAIVVFWKCNTAQDANKSLKKLVCEIHHTAGSLSPSDECLQRCIRIFNQFPFLINHPMPPYNYTPFLRACWSGNPALVRYMLSNGADLSSCTICGESPVYLAAYRVVKSKTWNPSVLELLYKAGCPLSTPTVKGITALHYAANAGHVSLTRWLLMHGAHLTLPPCKMTPFDFAVRIHPSHQSIASLLHLYCPKMVEGRGKKILPSKGTSSLITH